MRLGDDLFTLNAKDCTFSFDFLTKLVCKDDEGDELFTVNRWPYAPSLPTPDEQRILLDVYRRGYSTGHRSGDHYREREIKKALKIP